MVKVVLKHHKHERYSYTTYPDAKISLKPTEDVIEFVYSEGKEYTIAVNRKSIYESPLCYFNIINPFLYFWRFKMHSSPKSETSRALQLRIINFSAEKDDACLELALGSGDDVFKIDCTDGTSVSKVRVVKSGVSAKMKRRYAITNITNTLLFMLAVVVLLLVSDVGLGLEFFVVLLFDVCFSAYIVFSIIKQIKAGASKTKYRQ